LGVSITVFAYILFILLASLSAYLVSVSSVQPPLEHYDLEDDDLQRTDSGEEAAS
jgi:hypothetical protein